MRDKLKSSISFINGVVIALIVSVLVDTISVNDHIPFELAQTLFDALIQINATIIGFWGIIFAYFLKVLHDNRKEEFKNHQRIIEKLDDFLFENEINETRLEIWENKSCEVIEIIRDLNKTIRNFINNGVIVSVIFLISIFSSILFIGHPTNHNIHQDWLLVPIISLFMGIWSMFYVLWWTSPDTKNSEELAIKMRRLYNQRRLKRNLQNDNN